ncbi:hypothetical protein AHAS_Ahas17G0251100 [Arachis hypogaea]
MEWSLLNNIANMSLEALGQSRFRENPYDCCKKLFCKSEVRSKILVRFCICSVGIMGGGAHRFGTVTIHELDAEDEENFNVSEDSENCDATETPVDTGMEAEVEELEEESPNERHGEQNGSAEHVMLSRAQILEMEFANPDEACRFHEQYSRAKGFAMRQGKKMKNRKGEIVHYTYLCNREGFRHRKWLQMQDRKREHKVVTRCGCQDEMRIKRKANSTSWLGMNNKCVICFGVMGVVNIDYKIFGDVLAFDATCARNKYNLLVIVFFGVNHHNQTCVFGAAMVSSETQMTYVWVLGRFLECMGEKVPKAIITDGDRAMRLTIQEVFPEAHHRFCAWHLLKNATVNVCKPRFTTLLRNCMLADVEVEEFERQWEAMMDECGVWEVEWVKDLYAKKMSWATAYIRGCFYAGLRTTFRCESLHEKIGRDNEEELDFRSLYGSPVLQTQFPELEKSGALNYTKEIFMRLRDALKRSVRITIVECKNLDDRTIYVTQKYRRPEFRWTVAHHF